MGTSARPKIRFFDPQDEVKPVRIVQKTKSRPDKQPKTQYRLTNWPAYNQALIQRGVSSFGSMKTPSKTGIIKARKNPVVPIEAYPFLGPLRD